MVMFFRRSNEIFSLFSSFILPKPSFASVLVSRKFVDMTRIRIEGLLAAFPKLVGIEKQHTFVEIENVRLKLVGVVFRETCLHEKDTLTVGNGFEKCSLLSSLCCPFGHVPEYCPAIDVEGIFQSGFELIFAFKLSYVSMEYEASTMFDLHNLVISVPLPALRDTSNVSQVDGDWRFF
ncbi:hypothetical protein C5167_048995 [Papaver somniferum]|uniref:Coatomer subunit delta n=1 Tax=Papaver somniferum TaxID=3469 RepID=A0A4Y7KJJ9_PAPSO|nr:hypothetical protein C5167_048995 [Papaver somniferum]